MLPKPMVEIGGRPILWHIMRYYEHFGFTEFAVALGYKGDYIKRWFVDYSSLEGDIHLDLASRHVIADEVEDRRPWKVSLIETGLLHRHRGSHQAPAPPPRAGHLHGDLG